MSSELPGSTCCAWRNCNGKPLALKASAQVQRLMPGLQDGKVPQDLRRLNAFVQAEKGAAAISDSAASVEDFLHFVYQFLAASQQLISNP